MCSSKQNRLGHGGRRTEGPSRFAALARVLPILLGLALCLVASACSRGQETRSAPGPSASLPSDMLGDAGVPVGRIGLGLRAQPDSRPGADRIVATLSVSNAALLYQLSCRVTYDPLAVKPVVASRGELVGDGAAFFAPLAAAPDYVPLAFTYHPGESIPAERGALARIEFEVLDAARKSGIAVVSDPQYIIARTSLNQTLSAELGGAR
jgi:Cohesin domain